MVDTLRDAHPMMPAANHDELVEQRFILDLKGFLFESLNPNEKALAEALDPGEDSGELDQRAKTVRKRMLDFDSYRGWLALQRTAQEGMWNSIRSSIERQSDELKARADISEPKGSLRLNPDFVPPAYLRAADTHMMPGGYCNDPGDGDVTQGALMDRGGALYMLTLSGGLMNDGRGRTAMSHVLTRFPGFQPQRILDMGCGVGASTLPAAQCFPDAEVHGIDVGASVMRYAHARAESLDIPVHFSQQNAEQTDFPDGHFDLVYTAALIHETSHAAVPKIMAECKRLLRPGGVVVHLEVPLRYEDLDLWGHLISDYETRYNNEPFWTGALRADLAGDLESVGFSNVAAGFQSASQTAVAEAGEFSGENRGAFRSWYVVSAEN